MSNVTKKNLSKLWKKSAELNNPNRSDYLSELATALWLSGKLDDAIQVGYTLVETIDATINPEEWIEAKKLLCQCLYASERFEEAKQCIAEALQVAECFSIGPTYGVLSWFQADNEARLGNFDSQQKLLLIAIEEFNRNGLEHSEGAARVELGTSLYDTGRIDESITYLTSAVDLLENVKAVERIAFTKFKIGQALFDKSALVMSKKYFSESMTLFKFLKKESDAQAAKLELARCHAGLLETNAAISLFQELTGHVLTEVDQVLAARASFYKGLVLLGSENDKEARAILTGIEPVLRALKLDDLSSTIQDLQLC